MKAFTFPNALQTFSSCFLADALECVFWWAPAELTGDKSHSGHGVSSKHMKCRVNKWLKKEKQHQIFIIWYAEKPTIHSSKSVRGMALLMLGRPMLSTTICLWVWLLADSRVLNLAWVVKSSRVFISNTRFLTQSLLPGCLWEINPYLFY